jgi:hypothetical protein
LLVGGLAGLAPGLRQVAQVLAPLRVDLGLLRSLVAAQRHRGHAEHGDAEEPADHVRQHAAAAVGVHDRHRRPASDHRQQQEDLGHAARQRLGQLGRRLQRQLTAG